MRRWRKPRYEIAAALAAFAQAAFAAGAVASALAPYRVSGDAVLESLEGIVGDPVRGREVVLDRNAGNCLICHSVPEPAERFMGDIGPELTGVGSRLDAGQIRLRLINSSKVHPDTVMPPYYRLDGLIRVGAPWRDKPVLTSRQIEDVVTYLGTLKAAK